VSIKATGKRTQQQRQVALKNFEKFLSLESNSTLVI
jgi:hypothetical protein